MEEPSQRTASREERKANSPPEARGLSCESQANLLHWLQIRSWVKAEEIDLNLETVGQTGRRCELTVVAEVG